MSLVNLFLSSPPRRPDIFQVNSSHSNFFSLILNIFWRFFCSLRTQLYTINGRFERHEMKWKVRIWAICCCTFLLLSFFVIKIKVTSKWMVDSNLRHFPVGWIGSGASTHTRCKQNVSCWIEKINSKSWQARESEHNISSLDQNEWFSCSDNLLHCERHSYTPLEQVVSMSCTP